jgi:immunity protein 53 of polymorphic toxin system
MLEWLQQWYLQQCNGDWEHEYGVTIETTDNPGWKVLVELKDTAARGAMMQPYVRNLGDDDWVRCEVKDEVFVGYGDSTKLTFILETFRRLMEGLKAPGL